MGKLIIVRPVVITSATTTFGIPNVSRLLTPDPKEAVYSVNGTQEIVFDFGGPRLIDTVFLGFTSSLSFSLDWAIPGNGYQSLPTLAPGAISPELIEPTFHAISRLAAPLSIRFLRLTFTAPAAGALVGGVFAAGLSFSPTWGHEYGSGRPIEDTSTVERLFGGGFGINEGVSAGGYQWTWGDLTNSEVRQLYALARYLKTSRSLLMVEDPDQTAGIHERIHWGLFDRLDAYERLQPGASRYAFKIRDWA